MAHIPSQLANGATCQFKTLTRALVMKTAYCDTLKNGQFQSKFIPQQSLHLIKYIQFVGKMEKLLLENIF